MPALQRAGRRQRPRQPRHAGRSATATSTSSTARRSGRRSAHVRRVRHPHRPHQPRRAEAQGRLVLHLPDGRARHRDPTDHRDDRRPHLQRGVLHRRAHPGREPGRRRERGLDAGQGDARQRAGVAVERRRAVGHGPDRRRPARPRSAARAASPTRCCASASAQLHIEAEILRLIRLRTVTAAIKGEPPGPEASMRKVLADEHGQHIMALAKDLAGPERHARPTAVRSGEPTPAVWDYGYLFAPALTIGGGTGDVQRNIIAERVLGLPHDIDVEAGQTWAEARERRRRRPDPTPAATFALERTDWAMARRHRKRRSVFKRHAEGRRRGRPAAACPRARQGKVLLRRRRDVDPLPRALRERREHQLARRRPAHGARRVGSTSSTNDVGRAATPRSTERDRRPIDQGEPHEARHAARVRRAGSRSRPTGGRSTRRPASTSSGWPRPTASTRRASWATSPAPPRRSQIGSGILPIYTRTPDAARHDRGRRRRHVRRSLHPRARRLGPAGHRGLPRRALRRAASAAPARSSTSAATVWRARSRSPTTAATTSCRCPRGRAPGSASRSRSSPTRCASDIPIYVASLGAEERRR